MYKKRRINPKNMRNKGSLVVSDLQADTAEIGILTVDQKIIVPSIETKDLKADTAEIGDLTAGDITVTGPMIGTTLNLDGDSSSLVSSLEVKSYNPHLEAIVSSNDPHLG